MPITARDLSFSGGGGAVVSEHISLNPASISTKKKKLNFRTLASVSNEVQKDVEQRYRDNMLRDEEARILRDKENWLKTLEYMEENSHE